MYQNIMAAIDGSEMSLKAAQESIALAKVLGAKLTLITVLRPYRTSVVPGFVEVSHEIERRHDEEYRKAALKLHSDVIGQAQAKGIQCDTLIVAADDISAAIIENAVARKCDLIVMSSHGRRGVDAILLGSETAKVLAHSKTNVLIVR